MDSIKFRFFISCWRVAAYQFRYRMAIGRLVLENTLLKLRLLRLELSYAQLKYLVLCLQSDNPLLVLCGKTYRHAWRFVHCLVSVFIVPNDPALRR